MPGTNEYTDPMTSQPCDSIGHVRVDSTDRVVINRENLKYYTVSPVAGPSWGWKGRIVQKIGPDIAYGGITFGLYTTYDHPCDYVLVTYSINITDLSGKQVQNFGNLQGKKDIWLDTWVEGLYFISITSPCGRHSQKLAVQH